jgi:PAS domain S-box-containing protein
MTFRNRRVWFGTVLVAAGYFGGASLGLSLAFANRNVTTVWPPTGIAVAGLLVFGTRVWPGIAAGALLANVANGLPWATAAGIAVGNTLAPVVAAAALRHLVGFRASLERLLDVLGLIFVGGAASMLVSATLGTTTLELAGAVEPAAFRSVWLVWWVGDSMGVVLYAPILLTLVNEGRSLARHRVEAVLLGAGAAAMTYFVFGMSYPLSYLVFAFVVWGALRFQQTGAAIVTVIVTAVATWHTVHGRGQFSGISATADLLTLQSFNAAVAGTSLILAAVIGERERARRALQSFADELEARVVQRTEQLAAAERAARENEARLAEAQAIAHIGSWYWHVRRDEITWSDELYRIFGREPGSFRADAGGYLAALPSDERDSAQDVVGRALVTGEPFELRHRIVRPSGEERWVEARGSVLRDEAGDAVAMLGSVQDVTELRQADRLKDEFLATVSHELRTPLATIVGLADVLASTWGKQDEARRLEIVHRISQSATEMRRLIEQLLDFTRLQAGRVEVHPRRLCLRDAVALTVSKYRHAVDGHEVDIAVPADIEVKADEAALERVVGNLLSNGAKFSPVGSRLRVDARCVNAGVEVSVRDWGVGIPPVEQEHVFERFYQGSSAREQQGSGVGLAVAARYVQLQGGRIWVQSEPGQGSTFYFTLPATP